MENNYEEIKNRRKLLVLKAQRFFKMIFRGIGFKISVLLLLFSVSVSLMVIIPNFFYRAPIYSYFVKELNLPITYQVNGKVEILDDNGNLLSYDAEIFVGGYSTHTNSQGEYHLHFTAPVTNEVFLTIRYSDARGSIVTMIELIQIKDGNHMIEGKFVYYAQRI